MIIIYYNNKTVVSNSCKSSPLETEDLLQTKYLGLIQDGK